MRGSPDMTPEEARQVMGGHTWIAVVSTCLVIGALIAAPLMMYLAGSAWPGLAVFVVMGAFGVVSRLWVKRRLRVIRGESPPN